MGTGPGGSVFGKISFDQKRRCTRRGGRHVVKRSSDPRVAHPEVKFQVRDLVRVVGIVARFAPRGFSFRGKCISSSPRGYMGTVDLCRVPKQR